ncbi:MAG: cupin domain-containing protein [Paracoccaceae bacterium]
MSRKIDIAVVQTVLGTFYPPPYDEPCLSRERKKLGDAAGLTQFGVNLLRLPPGAWSSQRHWHSKGDEFIYVLLGEVTLVTDSSSELLGTGDAAGFKAGDNNGHCLRNLSPHDAVVLEVGTRVKGDDCTYSDIDMLAPASGKPAIYTHKDGTPYPDFKRRGRKIP